SGACGQCSATNVSLCTGATAVCDPASGTCVTCTVDRDGGAGGGCAASPSGHLCRSGASGSFCGCAVDADCGAVDSGRVCGGGGTCLDGCSPATARNHCPAGRFCSSNDTTGATVGACTTTCDFDGDCAAT